MHSALNKTYFFGPCAAESEAQVLTTARHILTLASPTDTLIFRAGVWKPRTSPASFQGHGEEALRWLRRVSHELHLPVACEVATPEHIRAAAEAGIDYLWIGARSSANPILIDTLTEAISEAVAAGAPFRGVAIKNPVNPDAALWLGNIERLERTTLPVMAIHRGCGHRPCWAMAHTLRTARPDIPLLLDPSHLTGAAAEVGPMLTRVGELALDGAMIEVHPTPQEALSDSRQQITPDALAALMAQVRTCARTDSQEVELHWLRAEIDELDDQLWTTIAQRMAVSERIGTWKQAQHMPPLQPERWEQLVQHRHAWAEENGLPSELVDRVLEAIHCASLARQQ